ncbi:hypothetical protein V6B14_23095 (plasmid) [Sporosarcina psychrophila]|uniref:hypothetical protein n=1 Tax=Sporosarcina psychrophila TaxID=1476 RepID=UPI0030CD791F
MMKSKVWLVRPLPHFGDHLSTFLEDDIIAVGYPVGESLKDADYEQIRSYLQVKGWGEGIGNVNILVNEMAIGDFVIVPSSNKKDIYFGEIVTDYVYREKLDEDLPGISGFPHQRIIHWFFDKKPYLRSDLPEALKGSLRYPGAVADLTKHFDLVKQIVRGNGIPGYSDMETKAWAIIEELLESDDEQIKLKAAELIISHKK